MLAVRSTDQRPVRDAQDARDRLLVKYEAACLALRRMKWEGVSSGQLDDAVTAVAVTRRLYLDAEDAVSLAMEMAA